MKKVAGWTLIAFLLTMIVLCSSCIKPGTITSYDAVVIKYGKTNYKVKQIQVGESSSEVIYIMYPINDSTKTIPEVVNYSSSDGDDTKTNAVVILK